MPTPPYTGQWYLTRRRASRGNWSNPRVRPYSRVSVGGQKGDEPHAHPSFPPTTTHMSIQSIMDVK
jgi:hypothetical protein